jgi:hypothetical protein
VAAGQTFDISNINAFAHASSALPTKSAAANDTFTLGIIPLTISLSGGLANPGQDREYLAGQKWTASLSAVNPLTITSRSWTVTGARPFANYVPSNDSGIYTVLSQPQTTTQFGGYFGGVGFATIQCAVHLSIPNGPFLHPLSGIDATVQAPATVLTPEYTILATLHGGTRLFSNAGGGFGLYMPDLSPGIVYGASVETPSAFVIAGDHGGWNFTQLVHLGRTRIFSGASQRLAKWILQDGVYVPITDGLDSVFPFEPSDTPPFEWSADGGNHTAFDDPSQSFEPMVTSYSVAENFETYLLYRPPGAGSVYVPLHIYRWEWGGVATLSGGSWSLANTVDGLTEDNATGDQSDFPQWNYRITAIDSDTSWR